MKGKMKSNNKGFSLVELIVVIAIMAVLIGILAPALIRYVDKSRRSTDVKNISEYMSAIQTYTSDHEGMAGTKASIKLDTTTATVNEDSSKSSPNTITEALTDAGLKPADMKLKSKSWGTDATLIIEIGSDMQPQFAITQTGAAGDYDISCATGLPATVGGTASTTEKLP